MRQPGVGGGILARPPPIRPTRLVNSADPIRDTILAQVRRGLALNRTPGLHYSGNFFDLSFERVTPEESRIRLPAGPWVTEADGQVNVGAVSMLADIALAATIRAPLPPETRLGTVSLSLQFSGRPWHGPLEATAALDGFFEGGAGRLGHSRVVVEGPIGMICQGSGSFMVLVPPKDMVLAPVPHRRQGDPAPVPLPDDELTDEERVILDLASRAIDARAPAAGASFIHRFFGVTASPTRTGASGRMPYGPHIGNRVGHVQGGLSLALAIATARAALPGPWSLSNVTASYVSPGEGHVMRARSRVVHRGRLTAVVRTQVVRPDRRVVLEVLSNHLRQEAPPA